MSNDARVAAEVPTGKDVLMAAADPSSDQRASAAQGWLRVTAVIVTWNAADHVSTTLAALPADLSIVVVDNASEDNTVAVVERVAPHARLIRSASNRGFAAAVNLALRSDPTGDYILLLNPDAVIDEASLRRLVEECDAHPDIAAASATVVDVVGASERYAGGREPSLTSVLVHELGVARLLPGHALYDSAPPERTQDRDWVAGTCVLLRRRAIDEVGLLDESYFLYAEDVDWCRRARDLGWRVVVVADARAMHERSRSVRSAGAWVDAHRIGSLDLYYARHHGFVSLVLFRGLRAVGAGLRAVGYAATGAGRPDRRALARQRWSDARRSLRPRRSQ